MRHLFDQYGGYENRLTHALACALYEDRRLLGQFLRKFVPAALRRRMPNVKTLQVSEQHLFGDAPADESDDCTGLPDVWIDSGEKWALLIESKIESSVSSDQLRRHLDTAARRGRPHAGALLLTKPADRVRVPRGVAWVTWPQVYRWLRHQEPVRGSSWAHRLWTYMEVLERRMVEGEKMKEGTLTEFCGIPFGRDAPYSYTEARRLLGLALDELRGRRALRNMGVDRKAHGRPAVTGSKEHSVWDFLAFRGAPEHSASAPHLDMGITCREANCYLWLPHPFMKKAGASRLRLDDATWADLLDEVRRGIARALTHAKGATPRVRVLQQRWLGRRGPAVQDADLTFDLDTAFGKPALHRRGPQVKSRPVWLQSVRAAISEGSGNLEIGIGAGFPYDLCPALRSPRILDVYEQVWVATKPILDVVWTRKDK